MWVGTEWDNVHKDVYNYAKCDSHKHAHLEDMQIGVWEKTERDLFEKWVRLKVMEPFLFMQTYSIPICNLWAKSADLLPKENFISDGRVDGKIKDIIVLVDTVAYHLPWMLQFLCELSQNCQQTKSLVVQNKRTFGDLQKCCLLEDASKCVAQNELYKIFKKYVPLDKYNEKMLVAAFCITFTMWQNLLDEDWCHTKHDLGTQLSEEQQKEKKLGNDEFKDSMFNQAVASYTKIIKKIPDNAIIYGNRAQAYIRLAKFDEAEIDGRRVVILEPTNCKGYLRMLKAKEGLQDYHSAHKLAEFASKVCSSNGNQWTELFDFGEELRNKCETDGMCSKGRRFMHQIAPHEPEKTMGLPELLSSGEESSDQEEEKSNQLQAVKVASNPPQEKVSLEPVKMFKYSLVELLQQLKVFQRQGSEALLSSKPLEAANQYLQALAIFPQLSEQNYETDVEDKVCLKYAMGIAYQRGPSEKLLDSLEVFQEILNNYGDLNFTPAHSAIGETYMKLFRFDQALEHLAHAYDSIEKGNLYRTYNWPGTRNVIEDSIPEKHKQRMAELIQNCQFPPNPDAVCRSDYCLLPSKSIYLGDPEFKGYYRLCCESGCKLEYHSQCWKRAKESLDRNKKGVVGQICLTPDCGQLVVGLEKFDSTGKRLTKSGPGIDKENKPKKSKSEKKSSQKELRKQQKRKDRPRQSSICDNEDQVVYNTTESSNQDVNNTKVQEPVKTLPPSYNVNDEPAYVIRKADPSINIVGQNEMNTSSSLNGLTPGTGKKKSKKSKKPTTVSVQEFCGEFLENESYYNQYLRRVHQLQQDKNRVEGHEEWPALSSNFTLNPESPFFVPEHLRNNPEELEKVLQRHMQTVQMAEMEQSQMAEIGRSEEIRSEIYKYMEDYVRENGPLKKNSSKLYEEVSSFPVSAQALINSFGGLESFLKKSDHFIFDGDMLFVRQTNSTEDILEDVSDGPKVLQDPGMITNNFGDTLRKEPKHVEVEISKPAKDFNIKPVQEEQPTVQRSNSLDSNKSISESQNQSLTPTTTQALRAIHKVSKSLSNDLQVALFKLQVCISALNREEQQQLISSVLNAVKSNFDHDFWANINPQLELVQISVKDNNSEEEEQDNRALNDHLLVMNKNLEERLGSALDTITQLQNAHLLNKSKLEDKIAELKSNYQKLQSTVNTLQSEKQHLQQEHQKIREESSNLKKLKEEEVATARTWLMKLTNENEELKSKMDKERDDRACLNNTISSLIENCEDTSKQLQTAKEELVKLKETEGLKLFDREIESVIKIRALLLDNVKREQVKPSLSSSVFEVLVEKPLLDCEAYLKKIKDLKNSFLALVNKHLEALQSGDTPPEIAVEIPVLPSSPESLHTISPATIAALGTPRYQLPLGPVSFVTSSNISQSSSTVSFAQTPTTQHSTPVFQSIFRPPMAVPSQPYIQQVPRPDVMSRLPNSFISPTMVPMFSQNQPFVAGQHYNILSMPVTRLPSGTPVPVIDVKSAEPEKILSNISTVSKSVLVNPQLGNSVSNTQKQESIQESATSSFVSKPENFSVNVQSSVSSTGVPNIKASSFSMLSFPQGSASIPPGMAPMTNMKNVTEKTELTSSKPLLSGPPGSSGMPAKPKVPVASISQKLPTSIGPNATTLVPKNNFDKLIRKLQENHPLMTSAELENYVQVFRSQRRGLSGLPIDAIIEGVSTLIQRAPKQEVQKARVITPAFDRGGSHDEVMRRPYSGLESFDKTGLVKGNTKDPWGAASASFPSWEGSNDNTCSICLESMHPSMAIHQTDCKHRFHFKCIQEWLKRNSKCPNCNSHTLLPTEFPPLGS